MKKICKLLLCLLAVTAFSFSVISAKLLIAEEEPKEVETATVDESLEDSRAATSEQMEIDAVYMGAGTTEGGTYDLIVMNGDKIGINETDIDYSINFAATEGSVVTLTAHSNDVYEFMGWYEGVQRNSGFVERNTGVLLSTDTTYIFTAENNKLVQAVFKYTKAYAVLLTEDDVNGTMIFTRSLNDYTNDTAGTLIDRHGDSYYGYIFSDVENTVQSGENVPWKYHRNEIKVAMANDLIRPISMHNWFYGCSNLQAFSSENFDTSETVTMTQMFMDCSKLSSSGLDIIDFDTSNVKKINGMFRGCSGLTSLNLGHFDTSKVVNMEQLFYLCENLKEVNVSNFDTLNVTTMASMFSGCKSLAQIDISHFNTTSCIAMYDMFKNCTALTSLDLSHFDTSKVQYFYGMFDNCQSLTELNLKNFNTTVADTYPGNYHYGMRRMFASCSSLKSLDISGFDTSTVQDMKEMFDDCDSLVSVTLGKGFSNWTDEAYLPEGIWDNISVHQVLNERSLYGQYPLNSADWAGTWQKSEAYAVLEDDGDLVFLRSHNTYANDTVGTISGINGYEYEGRIFSNVENTSHNPPWYSYMKDIEVVFAEDVIIPKSMSCWFSGASNLESFWGLNFNTSRCTSMFYLFDGCNRLNQLDISHFETQNVESMYGMFYHCYQLENVDLRHFDTSSLKGELNYLFRGCSNLESVDLSSFDTSRVTSMAWMFDECPKLTTIKLSSKFNTSNVTDMRSMFYGCGKLEYLDLSSFNTANVTQMEGMFANCFALDTVRLGTGWTKWIDNAYLTGGIWHHKNLAKSEEELYNEYKNHVNEWYGTWTRKDEPADPVYRLAGKDRIDTALLSAVEYMDIRGKEKLSSVILAFAWNFPDALSGSYLSDYAGAPVLLIDKGSADKVKTFIKNNLQEYGTVFVLGGEAVIPDEWLKDLDSFVIKRLAGSDRFDTNLKILNELGIYGKDILVCYGWTFADSLSAGATGKPILLVSTELTQDQIDFLASHTDSKIYIIGGTSAVNSTVEQQIREINPSVERIAGSDRYGTSVAIAGKFFTSPSKAVLAYAWTFPDGLSSGPLGCALEAPVLLVDKSNYSLAAEYCLNHSIASGYIMGGNSLVTDNAAVHIFNLTSAEEIVAR